MATPEIRGWIKYTGRWINELETEGVIIVLAGGNDGNQFMQRGTLVNGPIWQDQLFPQSFTTPSNYIITVGGVDINGNLYWPTTPVRPGLGGEISVYSMAVDVTGASNSPHDLSSWFTGSGTSAAAPVVVSIHQGVTCGLAYD